jgi:hypothetical protein
VQGLPYYK